MHYLLVSEIDAGVIFLVPRFTHHPRSSGPLVACAACNLFKRHTENCHGIQAHRTPYFNFFNYVEAALLVGLLHIAPCVLRVGSMFYPSVLSWVYKPRIFPSPELRIIRSLTLNFSVKSPALLFPQKPLMLLLTPGVGFVSLKDEKLRELTNIFNRC